MAALEFGTAGIRAPMGSGADELNVQTIAQIGLAAVKYLQELNENCSSTSPQGDPGLPIVIGYDARRNSRAFARVMSHVFANKGYSVKVFPGEVATPICAFATKELNAILGVMITASHNPPADNGVKFYLPSGAQLGSPQDLTIQKFLSDPTTEVDAQQWSEAFHPLTQTLSVDVQQAFLKAVQGARTHPNQENFLNRSPLRVAYTAMHGVGWQYIQSMCEDVGFTGMSPVLKQCEPDGNFPTTNFPNPEEPGAMDLAIEHASAIEADLIFANDPDADRLAVMVKSVCGDYIPLSGNELGIMLGYDVLLGMDPKLRHDALFVTTIVSSQMLAKIVKSMGAQYGEVLTGFSNIASYAAASPYRFCFGYEEALGYLIGDYIRDKDGVGTALRVLELAERLRVKGKTLLDNQMELAEKFGVFSAMQWSVRFEPSDKRACGLLDKLRSGELAINALGSSAISRQVDFREDKSLDPDKSNVLVYHSKDGARFILRPSGTEPKIKFYLETSARANKANWEAVKGAMSHQLMEVKALLEKDLLL